MTEITTFIGELDFHWHAPWLLTASLKTTAWLAATLLVLTLLKRASASLRHAVAGCAALGVPLIFLLSLSSIPDSRGWRPFAGFGASLPEVSTEVTVGEGASSPMPVTASEVLTDTPIPASTSPITITSIVVALFWIGCLVAAARFLRKLRKPRLSSQSVASGRLRSLADKLSEEFGLKSAPEVTVAPNAMPMTFGIRRPVIVLPAEASSCWSDDMLRGILRHELAHIQRRDVLWLGLAEAALISLWWNPLAKILRNRLIDLAELACDDSVISSGSEPTNYAESLLVLTRKFGHAPAPASGLAAVSGCAHVTRFRRLLDRSVRRRTLTGIGLLATALASLALLLPMSLLVSCATIDHGSADSLNADPAQFSDAALEIPGVPKNAEAIQLHIRFFEIMLSDKDDLSPSAIAWMNGERKTLSSDEGHQLFDPENPDLDLLSAPNIVLKQGLTAKIEVGNQVEVLNPDGEIEFAPVGVSFELEVWATDDPSRLRVNFRPSVSEIVDHVEDEDEGKVHIIRRLDAPYDGDFENGSYLIVGQSPESVVTEDSVPLLGDLPLFGSLFQFTKEYEQDRLIAVQVIASEWEPEEWSLRSL